MLIALAVAVSLTVAACVAVAVGMLSERHGSLSARRWGARAGLALGGVAAILVLFEFGFGSDELPASRRLASAHAMLDGNCAACHTSAESVSSLKCASCHEQFTAEAGAFGFPAHYVYASLAEARAYPRENETSCAACHLEHRGRGADLRSTATDRQCTACHAVPGFGSHPEFDFAAEAIADDAGLSFQHIPHVEYVLDESELTSPEETCLSCHELDFEGRGFLPIRFDSACSTCHLTGDIESAELPVQPAGTSLLRTGDGPSVLRLGVETIEAMRRRLGPVEDRVHAVSPIDFEIDTGTLVKTEIAHADPWILENLRRLRRVMYPSAGLADLLRTSADVPVTGRSRLYDEALATARSYTESLHGRGNERIHEAALEFERMVGTLERQIADPRARLDDAPFGLGPANPRLTKAQFAEIDAFAERLTEPCRKCHTVSQATIRRVQADQSVLRRARFDHGPHVIQRGCLDCHERIPVAGHAGNRRRVSANLDSATIQNVPGIATCQQCHAEGLVSDRCVTCHEFHPSRNAGFRHPRP